MFYKFLMTIFFVMIFVNSANSQTIENIISESRQNASKVSRKKALMLDVQIAEQEAKLARIKQGLNYSNKKALIGIDGVNGVLYAHFIDKAGYFTLKENDKIDGYYLARIKNNHVVLKKGSSKKILKVNQRLARTYFNSENTSQPEYKVIAPTNHKTMPLPQ